MAGGRQGVDRTIAILRSEIERTMKLLGVSTIAELEPRHVTQLTRLLPLAGAPAEAVGGGAPRVRAASGATARAPRTTANGKTDASASRPAKTPASKSTASRPQG
jgi:L-lactate dehydrogenase (cytochrome)